VSITFFPTPEDFRAWLSEHHADTRELWVGYYKKDSGKPSITYLEAVDEALCFGWIDGIRKSIDAESYMNRFTPRKPGSIWSATNIKRVEELKGLGKMQASGIQAFELRKENKSGIYSYEQRRVDLDNPYNDRLQQNQSAWEFYQRQSDYYRRAVNWWVVSAKKEETRLKRLDELIECCTANKLIPMMEKLKKTK
jgi:uncharacterized protein YdeI (YjbR/CyaY-like superfamily)